MFLVLLFFLCFRGVLRRICPNGKSMHFTLAHAIQTIIILIVSDYVYPYGPPPPPPDQPLPFFQNVKAAADAMDAAIYTAYSGSYSNPYQWATPFTGWVYQ